MHVVLRLQRAGCTVQQTVYMLCIFLECMLGVLQLYLHHLFGPSDLVTGEGAEFRGYHDAPPLPHPYYTVVNGSHFASEMSRYAVYHTICLFLHVLD